MRLNYTVMPSLDNPMRLLPSTPRISTAHYKIPNQIKQWRGDRKPRSNFPPPLKTLLSLKKNVATTLAQSRKRKLKSSLSSFIRPLGTQDFQESGTPANNELKSIYRPERENRAVTPPQLRRPWLKPSPLCSPITSFSLTSPPSIPCLSSVPRTHTLIALLLFNSPPTATSWGGVPGTGRTQSSEKPG